MHLLPGVAPPKHASEVQVLAGTAAVEARIFLPPDSSSEKVILVDLELNEPMALVPGERLLLRRPSPGMNIGAGRFLRFASHRLRRKDKAEFEALSLLLDALDSPVDMLARFLEQPQIGEVDVSTVANSLGWKLEATSDLFQQACKAGSVREMSAGRFLGMGQAGALAREVQGVLAHWRGAHPHRMRIPMALLRERLGKKRFPSLQKLPDSELQALGLERKPGLYWNMVGAIAASDWLQDADQILGVLREAALQPPSVEELAKIAGIEDSRVKAVFELLEDQDQVVRVDGIMTYSLSAVEDLRSAVVEQLQNGSLDIPAIRNRFGTTRKYLMPLLEFLDERGITARRGPNRILKDASAPLN
jgi:selenocysteine-specific elongation factor